MDESCSFNHLAEFIAEPHELDHGGKFHIPFVISLAKTGAVVFFFLYGECRLIYWTVLKRGILL